MVPAQWYLVTSASLYGYILVVREERVEEGCLFLRITDLYEIVTEAKSGVSSWVFFENTCLVPSR